jgi:FlaA1/EpsC-like NDP-sugar epimerase
MTGFLKGKNILVTGGSGSIGQALVLKALSEDAKHVKIFSNDENGQYEFENKIGHKKSVEFIIGDIRNFETVNSISKNIDIIFHAAALKHVDRCESNPLETVTVNVLGTENVIRAAEYQNVKKVIMISTDKAVNPVSVMGSTKLLAEKLISAANKNSKTIFSSVRFGNVLASRGSIIPKIEQQIIEGKSITLTDIRMKRYFMTINQSVDLIFSALKIMKGGEVFVLKMPMMLLKDLFEVMRDIIAPKYGHNPKKIKIKIIGKRAGEKIIEELITDFETQNILETSKFYIINPNKNKIQYTNAKKVHKTNKNLQTSKPLSKIEIKKLLVNIF